VNAASNRERFSVLFTTVAKNGAVLSPMDELVDRDHPLMYNPLKTDEYVVFRYSEEGFKVSNPIGGVLRSAQEWIVHGVIVALLTMSCGYDLSLESLLLISYFLINEPQISHM
jgi:hypothetical protein